MTLSSNLFLRLLYAARWAGDMALQAEMGRRCRDLLLARGMYYADGMGYAPLTHSTLAGGAAATITRAADAKCARLPASGVRVTTMSWGKIAFWVTTALVSVLNISRLFEALPVWDAAPYGCFVVFPFAPKAVAADLTPQV